MAGGLTDRDILGNARGVDPEANHHIAHRARLGASGGSLNPLNPPSDAADLPEWVGRHLAFGADPKTQMRISWQVPLTVKRPYVRIGTRPDDLRPGSELFANGNREGSNNFLMEEFWALVLIVFLFAFAVSEAIAALERRVEYYAAAR